MGDSTLVQLRGSQVLFLLLHVVVVAAVVLATTKPLSDEVLVNCQ